MFRDLRSDNGRDARVRLRDLHPEAAPIQNVQLEADFGEAYGKWLSEILDGERKYAVCVGGLTVPLHNAWADAAIVDIRKTYPYMELVGDR